MRGFGEAGQILESSAGGAQPGNARKSSILNKEIIGFGKAGQIMESSAGGAQPGNHQF